MKLRLFTRETQNQWINTGYSFVKLSNSEDFSGNSFTNRSFILLEPYLNNDEALESDMVVPISSPEIDNIVVEKSGMHYQ